ncbi:MAG TPA: hypothetical protein VFN97_20255 [Actinospica sp.]|nr:hypothetical protein [Actinospica sp.]
MSSFRHARAFLRNPITHAPAIGLAVAAVVVAVAPLTAAASARPAAASTPAHATVQHAAAQHTAAAPAKKSAAPAKPAAAKAATTTTTTVTHTASKAGHKAHESASTTSSTSTTASSKPYAGVGFSALEPTGTVGWQQSFTPNSDQWNNATAIVQAAKDLNLSPYAATIAVATAMQESTLRNLHYGDRDSLGLFQQRPSMGWGTPSELTDPTYAAKAFLRELPSGYQGMSLSDAAQSVQRSFDGSLYAQWESQAAYMVHAIANS